MKKPELKNVIFKATIAILCFFLIGGIIWGANNVLTMEGTMPPFENEQSLSLLPQSTEQAVEYINLTVNSALAQKPRLTSGTDVKILNDEENGRAVTAGEGGSLLNTVANYISESAADSIESGFAEISSDYGEGFAGKLWIPDISAGDIDEYTIDYIFFQCPSCNESFDAPADSCEKCGSTRALTMKYRDEYTITVKLPSAEAPLDAGAAIARNFRPRTADEIDALILESTRDYFDYKINSLEYSDVQLVFQINRLTDEIKSLSYKKLVDVGMTASFKNEYASLGAVPVSFTVEESVNFTFTWPDISLSAKEMSLEKKKTDVLKATLTCSNPVGTEVIWISSNENIATVDEEGYVTAGNTDGTAAITASMEFTGKSYTDSCTVHVKTSVEELDLSKRSLKLGTGETHLLTATVSPKKATIKTVKWYSTNESVATVDENGTVTATGKGYAEVYALSDDGYYKSTCKIEVTK